METQCAEGTLRKFGHRAMSVPIGHFDENWAV